MSTKSSSKVTSYSSPGKTTSYTSSSSRVTRPVSQAKGRYSLGQRGGRMSLGGGFGGGYGGGGGGMITREVSYGVHSASPQAMNNVSSSSVNTILTNRSVEKKDMQDLNERFAGYIEKVRFLEAQNKKLAAELTDLRSKWGEPSKKIKDMYEAELKQQKQLYDDSVKDNEKLRIQVDRLTDNLEEANDKIERLEQQLAEVTEDNRQKDQQISDLTTELELLRKRIDSLESERARDKAEIERLNAELMKARMDLDNETLARVDAENRCHSLEEEFEFMKRIMEQELKDLAALAYRDTTEENRSYWKNGLSKVIRDLRKEYDRKLDTVRSQSEAFNNVKMQEFSTGHARKDSEVIRLTEINRSLQNRLDDQNERLAAAEAELAKYKKLYEDLLNELDQKQRDWDAEMARKEQEIAELRAGLEQLMANLDRVTDAKLSLELEITAYRLMLEGEETRLSNDRDKNAAGDSPRKSRDSGKGAPASNDSATKPASSVAQSGGEKPDDGEMQAKTTYSRTAKGPVSICATGKLGEFVEIENSGRDDFKMDGYSISRNIDGKATTFKIPGGIVLSKKETPGSKIRFYKKGGKDQDKKNATKFDMDTEMETWGMGAQIITMLLNQNGNNKATHTQKTVFTT
uniref:Cytoplasmic intermediate filament protein n=1 Tax=Phoronis ijimai TaxID=115423 RepID=O97340_9BILA|nr:cytoplasmic intermediate filament protein [Phoronis ijimai]